MGSLASISLLAFSFIPAGVEGPIRFLLVGGLAAVMLGVAKAGFGGGIGILSTPMMIYACGDGQLANGIMLPLLIACDYVTMLVWRGQWRLRTVAGMLPGMLLGVALGAAALWGLQHLGAGLNGKELTNTALTLVVGLIALGFSALHVAKSVRKPAGAYHPRKWHGLGAGAAAGVTSTLAQAAGPVTQMYLLPQRMPKGQYVATTVLFFWITNQVKLVPYWALGMISATSLGADLALLPGLVAGVALGVFLHRRINQKWFDRVVWAMLAVMGAHLSVASAMKLWSS